MKLLLLAWFIPILLASIAYGDESGSAESNGAVVTIGQGKLQGLTLESRKGRKYYGFLGIPFAKAPIRFGLAQPPDSWEGTRMANKLAPHCFQFCLLQQKLIGVEDCLTLNIYSPKLDTSAKLPVMVHIHCGGFQFGSGSFSHGKYFADEDVVLVTIQYRLGALGFLSTEDDVVPGNMGLKDQTAALKWVKENIQHFGGDPNKVNIFGSSAGGASVHYHLLSPMSKGLFTTAISQSGSALNPWAQQPNPKELAIRLAKDLGCTDESSEKMVDCLRSKTPAEIVTAQMKFSKFPVEFDLISMLFSPSVEKGQSEPKFLPDTPYKMIVNGQTASSKVPWISGLTPEEGAFYIAMPIENEQRMELINSDWFKMAPNILYYERIASPATQSRVSKEVKDFYFGDEKIGQDNYVKFGRVFGDRFFTSGISRAIREHAKRSMPVYPYIFSFPSQHSIQKTMLYSKKDYGIGHAEELKFMFNKTYGAPDFDLDTPEGKFSEKLIKLWVSFAKDGKPTATWGSEPWNPFTLSENEESSKQIQWYLFDENPPRTVKEDPFKERTDFWENLPLREFEKEDYPEEKDEL